MALFSRKHRLSFFFLFVLVFLFLFVLYNLHSPPRFRLVEPEAFSFISSFQKAVNSVFSFPVRVWDRYVFLVETEEKNRLLIQENKGLRQEIVMLQEHALANQRLRELLDFKKASPNELLAAQVVGLDASLYFQSFSIDKGEKDGVKKGMAVVTPEGVAGRILKVADSFSQVLLLEDSGFALDALVQRTRARGVVEGMGGGLCRMKYVLLSEDVRADDLVVASGLEGFFPKGTIVGRVSSVKREQFSAFQEVIVAPAVELEKTEEVFVVLKRKS